MFNFLQLLQLAGGLGLFLYGMRVMSDNIQRRAGSRMQRILGVFTTNRFAGVLTGLGITSIIQSSSATTVLLVSIVNAGLMGLEQAIGVIMGANIGTTLTGWIISVLGFKFSISAMALPAVALGMTMFFSKVEKRREVAGILIGFGILFLGLGVMKDSVPDLKNNTEVLSFLQHFNGRTHLNVAIFIIIGTLLTIMVQSSSAAMAITITMAYKGWINFPTAAAIVLGENIGTTITAYLASLGMNVNAKRAARAHMLFNLIGVAWMFVLFFPALNAIDRLIPGLSEDPHNIPIHLSAFHTGFNIVNTMVLIGFVKRIAAFARKLVPDPLSPEEPHLAYLNAHTAEDVDANLISAKAELGRMSEMVCDMSMWLMNALQQKGDELQVTRTKIQEYENKTDKIRDNMIAFLTECMTASLSEEQAMRVQAMHRIAHELESIGDGCRNTMRQLYRGARKEAIFHQSGTEDLARYHSHVLDFLQYNHACLTGKAHPDSMDIARDMEKNLNQGRNKLRKQVRKLLSEGADVRGQLVFLDVVRMLEQIGDRSYNIAAELRNINR